MIEAAGKVALEGAAALAQGGVAVALGALARALGRVSGSAQDGAAMTWMSRSLTDRGVADGPKTLAVIALALVAVRGALSIASTAFEVRAGARESSAARADVLAAALGGGGISIGSAIEWPAAIEAGARASWARRRALVQLVVLAAVVIVLDATLAAVIVAALVPFAAILRAVRRAIRAGAKRASEGAIEVVDAVRDVVEHAHVWATCGGEATAMRRVVALSREGEGLAVRAARVGAFASALNEVLAGLAIVVLVAVFAPGRPMLVPVLVVLVSSYRPLRDLAEGAPAIARAADAQAAMSRLPTSIAEAPAIDPPPKGTLSIAGFALDVGGEIVREGVTVDVEPGSPLAIVGAPGTGKSALLEAIVGVRRARGAVAIGASRIDARPIGLAIRSVAWMPPSPPILPGTLAENLAPDAPEDEARVARAMAILEALDPALAALDWKTRIGARARALSSGEAQRVALARVLATDAAVVLLDEPTASLDAEGEQRAIAAIDEATRDRVLVMVTHRPAPIAIAAATLSLDHGSYAHRKPSVASRRSVG